MTFAFYKKKVQSWNFMVQLYYFEMSLIILHVKPKNVMLPQQTIYGSKEAETHLPGLSLYL
jgi:hypothetical protein